jgi:hypothetical protein
MNRDLGKIQEKLRQASKNLRQWELLPAGEHSFTIFEASIEHDDKRKYDFVYVKLDCGSKLASDTFPVTDKMLWKLTDLLRAVGVEIDSFTPEALVGRSGKLTAEPQPDGKVFYQYEVVVT